MAGRHSDPFSIYSTNGADLDQTYVRGGSLGQSVQPTVGRYGGPAFRVINYDDNIKKMLNPTVTEVWAGFAFNPYQAANNSRTTVVAFYSASGMEGKIAFNPFLNTIQLYRGDYVTLLDQRQMVGNSVGYWRYWEVRYRLSATVGQVEVWIDGVLIYNLSGLNTSQTGATQLNAVGIGPRESSGVMNNAYYTDFYILDNVGSNTSRLGDLRMVSLVPTIDTGPNDGAPSTGTAHWALVDELPFNTTDYLDIPNIAGQAELFGLPDLPAGSSILGVTHSAIVQKTTATAVNVALNLKSGATEAVGPTTALTTSFTRLQMFQDVDPNTSAAWSVAAINALTAGIKVI